MNTAQVSFERGNSVLEPHVEFLQFRFIDLEYFFRFWIKKKMNCLTFFIIVKSVTIDIFKKTQKSICQSCF